MRFRQYRRHRRRAPISDVVREGDAGIKRTRVPRNRSFFVLLGEFWRLLRHHRLRVYASLGTLTVATVIALAMPVSTKIALDYILTDNPGPEGIPAWLGLPRDNRPALLWILGAGMMAVTLASIAFGTWGRYQMTALTKRTQVLLRKMVFEHAVRLPLHRVYQIKSGGAASILREDAGGAGELVFSLIYNPWRAIVQLTGTLIILATVDWVLLLGGIASVPVIWFTHRSWVARIRPVWRDIRATRTTIDAHATEAFGGMRVVRGFQRQEGEAARFIRANHFMARQELLAWWLNRAVEIAWMILIPLGSVIVLVYGGSQVLKGHLTIGDVMMFGMYLVMLLGPLEMLASSATGIQNSLAGFDRVLDLLAEPREFAETPARVTVNRTALGRITLRDVWFAYPGGSEPVIRGVNLDVEPGTTVAFVGPSGSGKTTLSNLIARFYDPTEGMIALDGVDLRRVHVDSYRRLLGIVEQDVFLFDGTIAENIGYARRGATHEEVVEAARIANAAEFIERLDRGYDTLVGERGVRLSGGQKQRVAIARAVLADPLILILDEATSNLDTESEALIQRSLDHLMRNRTCFVIAHRLSTIRHADLIVVLEGGRILEQGTHEELLARGGRYAEFLRMQIDDTFEPAEVA